MAKTARQLKITEGELKALKKVQRGLNSGEYRHVKNSFMGRKSSGKPIFNMAIENESYSCGQVACIGDWMALQIKHKDPAGYVHSKHGKPIHELFFPPDEFDWEDITPKNAAAAIDNFRKTGDPNWYGIIKS